MNRSSCHHARKASLLSRLGLVFALSLSAVTAQSDWQWSPVLEVIAPENADSVQFAMNYLSGHAVVAWSDSKAKTINAINYENGYWGPTESFSEPYPALFSKPQIAVSRRNSATIAWISRPQDAYLLNVARWDASQRRWKLLASPFKLDQGSVPLPSTPVVRITQDDKDILTAVWLENGPTSGEPFFPIRVVRLINDQWGQVTTLTNLGYSPEVKATRNGMVMVVWSQKSEQKSTCDCLSYMSSARLVGGKWITKAISPPGFYKEQNPTLATDGTKVFHAAWDKTDTTARSIIVNRFISGRWGSNTNLSGPLSKDFYPLVTANSVGQAVLVWLSFSDKWSLMSSRFDELSWTAAKTLWDIKDGISIQQRGLTLDNNGNATTMLLTWNFVSSNSRWYAAMVSHSVGDVWEEPSGLVLGDESFGDFKLVGDRMGKTIMLWRASGQIQARKGYEK